MAKKGESTTNQSVREAEYPIPAEDYEEISRLAYSYWQARGCPIGSPEEDWYRAETELRQPITATAAA
jgi:hypothetical protein